MFSSLCLAIVPIYAAVVLNLAVRAAWELYVTGSVEIAGINVQGRITNALYRPWYPRIFDRLYGIHRRGQLYLPYNVRFRFEWDGVQWEKTQSVGWKTYLRLTPGTFVTVAFVPDRPKIARLGGVDVDHIQLAARIFWLIFAIPFSLIVAILVQLGLSA